MEQELRVARRKANWHFVWTVLGISPAAIIPAVGLIREGRMGLLVLLAVLVTISQGYLGAKAARKAGELEATLENLKGGEQCFLLILDAILLMTHRPRGG